MEKAVLSMWQNRVIIDVDAFSHNVKSIRASVSDTVKLITVVKDDCYGHGATELAPVALACGADILAVVNIDEARALRNSGIQAPILVMGITGPYQIDEIPRWGLSTVISEIELAHLLQQTSAKRDTVSSVYVKVDTGMGRLGVLPSEAVNFVKQLKDMPNLRVEGLMSHFPNADAKCKDFANEQINKYIRIIDECRDLGVELKNNTLGNSAAITDLPNSHFNAVRAGIILYGSYPSNFVNTTLDLRPVMGFKTPIIRFKTLAENTTVSYTRAYTLKSESVIATTPLGYRHGFLRALSNKTSGLFSGGYVAQAGVICMDMCMYDLGKDASPELGDEITVIGRDGENEIRIEELALAAGTIPYELMTSLGMRSRRYYVRDGVEYEENRVIGHRLQGE